jgi:hypothetical protein
MEGLSLMLNQAQEDDQISRVKTSRLLKIILLLFMDDVLIMTKALVSYREVIDYVPSLFCRVSGLVINPHKYSLHYSGIEDYELDVFKAIFPYKFVDLDASF